ncbi:MAG: hypothetical protein ABSF26_31865 [Thermoguttaceae bacterium]|jgi:hypothetical protein
MEKDRRLSCRLHPEVQILRTGSRSFDLLVSLEGQRYRLGPVERYLLLSIERCQTWGQLFEACRGQFGSSLAPPRIEQFVEQLRETGLVVDDAPPLPRQPPAAPAAETDAPGQPRRLNLLCDVLVLLFGWLLHPLWIAPILVLAFAASCAFVHHWSQFVAEEAALWNRYAFVPTFVFTVCQSVIVLNVPSVLVSGMVCRRHRGSAQKTRVYWWRNLLPIGVLEPSDALLLTKPRFLRGLIATKFFFNLAAASLFVCFWLMSTPHTLPRAFWLIMIFTGVLAIAVQLNPFAENTVYWLLVAVSGDWRLHEDAVAETWAWLVARPAPQPLSRREQFWFRVYGLVYFLYRMAFDGLLIFGVGYWVVQRFGAVGGGTMCFLVFWAYHRQLGLTLARPRRPAFGR